MWGSALLTRQCVDSIMKLDQNSKVKSHDFTLHLGGLMAAAGVAVGAAARAAAEAAPVAVSAAARPAARQHQKCKNQMLNAQFLISGMR